MSNHIVRVALLSAVLIGSCAPLHPDIRPEVAQPLDEARVLANGWSDKAVVIAKLNQAESVPNLNQDEQDQIRATTIYALARVGSGVRIPGAERGAPQTETNYGPRDSPMPSMGSVQH